MAPHAGAAATATISNSTGTSRASLLRRVGEAGFMIACTILLNRTRKSLALFQNTDKKVYCSPNRGVARSYHRTLHSGWCRINNCVVSRCDYGELPALPAGGSPVQFIPARGESRCNERVRFRGPVGHQLPARPRVSEIAVYEQRLLRPKR